jgi:hypothetical protein
MANEMFTTRYGKQVPVPVLVIPSGYVTSLMRLQEDYIQRGEHLSLLGVVLDVIDKGKSQVRNQWKNGDLSKNRRDFAKAVAPYMVDPAKFASEIATLARKHGLIAGTAVDMSKVNGETDEEVLADSAELTEEQLEAATAPEAV